MSITSETAPISRKAQDSPQTFHRCVISGAIRKAMYSARQNMRNAASNMLVSMLRQTHLLNSGVGNLRLSAP
jgi:hypothetical protein